MTDTMEERFLAQIGYIRSGNDDAEMNDIIYDFIRTECARSAKEAVEKAIELAPTNRGMEDDSWGIGYNKGVYDFIQALEKYKGER